VRIAQLCLPDLILLDENIPAGGIETAREISKICPFVKTVMLTIWEGTEHATAGRDADVCICIAKGVSGADLLATLRSEVFKDRESRDSVF
jgi:two-component system nitrate/nitrite response regulator NarL